MEWEEYLYQQTTRARTECKMLHFKFTMVKKKMCNLYFFLFLFYFIFFIFFLCVCVYLCVFS